MIGKNIAEIRKRRGLTLSELAESAKVSKSYLSNIERSINKNPSIDVLQRLAKVLHIDFITLVEFDKNLDSHLYMEEELVDLLRALKEIGIDKNDIKEFKTLVEFIKWEKRGNK